MLLTSGSEMVDQVGKGDGWAGQHLTMSMVSIICPSVKRLPSIE